MRQDIPVTKTAHAPRAALMLGIAGTLFASTAQAQVESKTQLLNVRSLSAPAKGGSVVDPTFGVSVKRLTNRGQNGGMATAEYSQLQAFNADDTKILVTTDRGRDIIDLNGNVLYSGLSLNLPRWHPTIANVLYSFNRRSGGTIYLERIELNAGGTVTRTNHVDVTALGYATIDEGCWEDLSSDGRFTALLNQENSKVSVLDLSTKRLVTTVNLAADVDWVAVSPSGQYLVVQYVKRGTGPTQGLAIYGATNGRLLGHATDHYAHGDLGKDESGFDVFGTIAYTDGCNGGRTACTSISPLPNAMEARTRNDLLVMAPSIGSYTSCRNERNGGFCLHGDDYASNGGAAPFAKEIWLTRMFDGAVLRLFHHRSSSCSYYNMTRPTISRSGRYAVFSSDWARPNCSDQSDLYMIDLQTVTDGWAPLQ